MMLPFLMIGIVYFVGIRPMIRRQKDQAATLAKLVTGDEIITRGGIIGKITGVAKDDTFVVEIQEKVRVRIPRAFIEGRWTSGAASATSEKTSSAAV